MTQLIEIQPIANQTLSIDLDDERWELTLKSTGSAGLADISRGGVLLLQGIRVVAGTPIIPYSYIQSGNFVITTDNGEIPNYQRFGVNQFLIFASRAELVAFSG